MLSAAGTQNDQLIQQKLEIRDQPEPVAQAEQIHHEDQRAEDAPQVNPNIRKLTHLHRRVLEHYAPGMGYRDLGEIIGTGKDKAGELLSDVRKWGFLPQKDK
jgi:hypothetical protein